MLLSCSLNKKRTESSPPEKKRHKVPENPWNLRGKGGGDFVLFLGRGSGIPGSLESGFLHLESWFLHLEQTSYWNNIMPQKSANNSCFTITWIGFMGHFGMVFFCEAKTEAPNLKRFPWNGHSFTFFAAVNCPRCTVTSGRVGFSRLASWSLRKYLPRWIHETKEWKSRSMPDDAFWSHTNLTQIGVAKTLAICCPKPSQSMWNIIVCRLHKDQKHQHTWLNAAVSHDAYFSEIFHTLNKSFPQIAVVFWPTWIVTEFASWTEGNPSWARRSNGKTAGTWQ